jgi:hypothetical protein
VIGDYDPVNALPLTGFDQLFDPDQAILGINSMAMEL